MRNCLAISYFYSKSKQTIADPSALFFSKYKIIIGSCLVNFCSISMIHATIKQELSHDLKKCLKSDSNYPSSNSDDFSVCHWSVHYDLFKRWGKEVLQQQSTVALIKTVFALQMLSFLLGPMVGGGKRALGSAISLIFGQSLTICTLFQWELSHNFDSLFKIQFLQVQLDLCIILTRIISKMETCFLKFWNQNLISLAQTVIILVCIIEFLHQTEQWELLIAFFLGGWGAFSIPFLWRYMKSTQKATMSVMSKTWGKAWEKPKFKKK